MDIIAKIKEANLCGRGGAGFPVGKKWEMVRDAQGDTKFVIVNGSEGEPGVLKDSHILKEAPEKVVQGLILGMKSVGAQTGYLYLRADLYKKHKKKLEGIIEKEIKNCSETPLRGQGGVVPKVKQNKSQNQKRNLGVTQYKESLYTPQPPQGGFKTIHIFREDGKYLNGEETTMLNSIEKKRSEPRFKPPFPTTCGLFGCPTLINNVETFYRVSQIAENKYKNQRFYSLTGKIKNPGVFELDVDLTIEQVLKKTKNYPQTDFFVQAGGGACGAIYTKKECQTQRLQGAGALIVHNFQENPLQILQKWTEFFLARNCGQCLPCREGFYRLNQLLKQKEINYALIKKILEVMADASFCGLGQFAPEGYLNFIEKILKK